MGAKHKTLNDDIFRHSKYIEVINKQVGCKDFKNFCQDEDNKDFKGQYDFMLDTFRTLILLNNCFYSDSNLSIADKVANALDIMEAYLYIDTDKKKYSVRFIQGIIEKHSTYLYRKINDDNNGWYEMLGSIPNKDVSTSNYVKIVMEEIEKEMTRLESVGFDDMVKGSINYKKNKNSDYKIYISRFDSLNTDYSTFVEAYKNEYNERHTNTLTYDDLTDIGLIYTLVAKANNGIVITLDDKDNKDYNLNENSTPKDYYEAYLDSLNIGVDDTFYKLNVNAFMINFELVSSNVSLSTNDIINNFDMFYFLEMMRRKKDFTTIDDEANKVLDDLKKIYEIITKTPTSQDDMLGNFKVGYGMVQKIIDRYQDYYIRVS